MNVTRSKLTSTKPSRRAVAMTSDWAHAMALCSLNLRPLHIKVKSLKSRILRSLTSNGNESPVIVDVFEGK